MNNGFDMNRVLRCDSDRTPSETNKLFGWSDFILKYVLIEGWRCCILEDFALNYRATEGLRELNKVSGKK